MPVLRHSLVFVVALSATAQAGTRTRIAVDTAAHTCTRTYELVDGDDLTFEVTLSAPVAVVTDVVVTRTPPGQATAEVGKATILARATTLAAPLKLAAQRKDVVKVGPTAMGCQFTFAPPEPFRATAPDAPPPQPAPADQTAADNAAARAFLETQKTSEREKITDHGKTGHPWGHTYRLYHLPDGSLAFPMPRGISEEDHLEPWIVRVVGEQASVEVTQCGDVPSARISGTRPGKAEVVNAPKSGDPHALDAAPTFELTRLSAPFKCADAAAYKLTTARGEREVSLSVAPVYLFSWGLAYGFDFGRPSRIALVDRAVEGGTEKVIARTTERAGFRPMATLTLNACRANLKAWDLCDAFGLTAMADLEHLTEGGGLGIKLQPYPGLGVLIGMTFFQVDTIRAASGLKIGGVFTEPGELPIHKQYTRGSFGLFLGVGGDTATVKSLF